MREFKFIDALFDLQAVMWEAGYSVKEKHSRADVQLAPPGGTVPKKVRSKQALMPLEMRVLKLTVRLWMMTFLHNRQNENYIAANGWMDRINGLNGLGLGAADVLSSLVTYNKSLIMKVELDVILKFITFIKTLGPDSTWLAFLRCLTACDDESLSSKQQEILRVLYDQGRYAPPQEKLQWGKNREECLLSVKLSEVASRPFPVHQLLGTANVPEQFLGQELVEQQMLYDIQATWNQSSAPWNVGDPYLYHGPEVLCLDVHSHDSPPPPQRQRRWVLLRDVVWVLNQDLASDLGSSAWQERKKKADGGDAPEKARLEALGVLSRYFLTQLHLLADLCGDRQLNVILSVEKEYSLVLILCAMLEQSLPTVIRAAFVNLTQSLWLNRHPHRACTPPNIIRSYMVAAMDKDPSLPTFQLLDAEPDGNAVSNSFYTMRAPSKFWLLNCMIQQHLEFVQGSMYHDQESINRFTVELLEMMRDLLNFGFVNSQADIDRAVKPTLSSLDGRTDWLKMPPKSDTTSPQTNGTSRGEGDLTKPLLASNGPQEEHEAVMIYPPEADGKDRYTSKGTPVEAGIVLMKCKDRYCKILKHVLSVHTDFCIGKAVAIFRRDHEQKRKPHEIESSAKDLLAAVCDKRFAFDSLEFHTILLDLLMYDSAELFASALELLVLKTKRTEVVLKDLAGVLLLCTPNMVELRDSVLTDILKLSNLIHTHEIWGCLDEFGPIDKKRVNECKNLCIKLRQHCSVGGAGNDSDEPDRNMQSMLLEMGLVRELKAAFHLPIESLEAEAAKVLKEIMTLICQLLVQMLHSHSAAQAELFSALSNLKSWLNYGVGVSNTITEIFKGNQTLCERVPEELIYHYGKVITARSRGFQPHQLSFFDGIVAIGQRPVLKNKELVLEMFKDKAYSKCLHFFNTEDERERRKKLLRGFTSWDQIRLPEMFRKWKGDDAEMVYNHKSLLLLCSLCHGRDRAGGVAFVQALCPARNLAVALIEIDQVQREDGMTSGACSMCKSVKAAMWRLLQLAYYESDMRDTNFLCSEAHALILEMLMSELGELLSVHGRKWDGSRLSIDNETYIHTLLQAVNSYLELSSKVPIDVARLVTAKQDFGKLFGVLSNNASKVPHDNELFKVGVLRALSFIKGNERGKMLRLHTFGNSMETNQEAEDADSKTQDEINASFKTWFEDLKKTRLMENKLQEESKVLIQRLMAVDKATDPIDAEYKHLRESSNGLKCPDFRRNIVTLEDLLQRIISHCLENLQEDDWPTILRSLELLHQVLLECRDEEQLENLQLKMSSYGVVKLVIETLMAKPENSIVFEALELGITLLEPNNPEVQASFSREFYNIDDTGLWEIVVNSYDQAIANLKPVRALKAVQRRAQDASEELRPEEQRVLDVFVSQDLRMLKLVMRLQQVFCEGHNFKIQEYIFQQVDNLKSYNLVEKTGELIAKMAKSEHTCDVTDSEEAQCLGQALDLLVELMQGPCPRNQEVLSVSGLVEVSQKMLRARFKYLVETAEQDPYPEDVRELKSKILITLNSMLECRRGEYVHRNVMYRLDRLVLKARLVFVFRYFVASNIDGLMHGALEDNPELDRHTAHDPEPHFLEALSDEGMNDMFGEAFGVTMLLKQLMPISEDFKTEVSPSIPKFIDNRTKYVDENSYKEHKRHYEEAIRYQRAYFFFERFIRCIEVVIDGQLQEVYFRLPKLCGYVLGAEKQRILETVSFESPEDKAKEFIEMALQTYRQTLHTESLSKWRLLGCWCFPTILRQPFYWFLKNDSKNLSKLSQLSLMLSFIIALALCGTLRLGPAEDEFSGPVHIVSERLLKQRGGGAQSVPVDVEEDSGTIEFRNVEGQILIESLGALQFGILVLYLFILVLLFAPLEYDEIRGNRSKLPMGCCKTLQGCLLTALVFLIVVHGLSDSGAGLSQMRYIFGFIAGFVVLGMWWGTDIPNNRLALSMATTIHTVQQPRIARSIAWASCCFLGHITAFWYSFLMLDVVFHSPVLQTVMKAVTVPFTSLAMTFLVGLIIMFQYGILAFYVFRTDFNGSCTGVFECAMTVVYEGLRADIGSSLRPTSVLQGGFLGRFFYDMSFYIIITTVLLNVIFGIICDTFGSLRDTNNEREEHMATKTFISCLDRQEVDRAAQGKGILNGFIFNEERKQNKWDFMHFVFHLRLKDATEYTGPESSIFTMLESKDITWFPLNRAKLLEDLSREEDEDGDGIADKMEEEEEAEQQILGIVTKLQTEMTQLRTDVESMKSR